MKKINLNLNASVATDKLPTTAKATSLLSKAISYIKIRAVITCWILSLMMLFTDNFIQAVIALFIFAASSRLLEKNKEEVNKLVENLEQRFDRIINK